MTYCLGLFFPLVLLFNITEKMLMYFSDFNCSSLPLVPAHHSANHRLNLSSQQQILLFVYTQDVGGELVKWEKP